MINNEEKEIVIDTKKVHFGHLHSLIQNGGSIKFHNFPFGIRLRGIGGPYVNVELFAIPVGVEYKGHMNPRKPKETKKEPKIEVEEDEEIVM